MLLFQTDSRDTYILCVVCGYVGVDVGEICWLQFWTIYADFQHE